MIELITFASGLIIGLALFYLVTRVKKHGVLEIEHVGDDKDRYIFKLTTDLGDLPKKKFIVLAIKESYEDSQEKQSL